MKQVSQPGGPGLPLSGQRIVVTRAASQAEALAGRLRDLGAEVIELPAIEIRPPADFGPLDAAIARLPAYDWIIFTSANGVRWFLERLKTVGGDLQTLRARICAIGPATGRAVEAAGLKVDLMPGQYVAESLVEAFAAERLEGRHILLPRAAGARELAPAELRRRGAVVDVVEAYRAAPPENLSGEARRVFGSQIKPDWVTFTSTSTVKHLVEAAGTQALQGVRIASIGPITSAAVRRYGLEVTAEARQYTAEGLVQAILSCLQPDPLA